MLKYCVYPFYILVLPLLSFSSATVMYLPLEVICPVGLSVDSASRLAALNRQLKAVPAGRRDSLKPVPTSERLCKHIAYWPCDKHLAFSWG